MWFCAFLGQSGIRSLGVARIWCFTSPPSSKWSKCWGKVTCYGREGKARGWHSELVAARMWCFSNPLSGMSCERTDNMWGFPLVSLFTPTFAVNMKEAVHLNSSREPVHPSALKPVSSWYGGWSRVALMPCLLGPDVHWGPAADVLMRGFW